MKLPESILILAPHPDDETFMAAGVIRNALTQKAKISVCVITNGGYLCTDKSKGSARLSESLNALRYLGMTEDDIYFLGYPDTGAEAEISFLNNLYHCADPFKVFPSANGYECYGITGGKQDFRFEVNGRHSSYNRECFQEDLDEVLLRTKPKLIITSSKWDTHADHAALFHLTLAAACRVFGGNPPEIWESLIHSPAGDSNWPVPDAPYEGFTKPPGLEDTTDLKWEERIRIPLPEYVYMKYEAIKKYESALKADEEPEVVSYLLAFAKMEEIFWKVKDGAYGITNELKASIGGGETTEKI